MRAVLEMGMEATDGLVHLDVESFGRVQWVESFDGGLRTWVVGSFGWFLDSRATVRCRSLFGGLASTGLLGGTQLITRRSRDGHPFSGTMIEIRLVVFIVRIDVSWGADQDGCVQVVQESYRSFIPLHSVSVHNKAQPSAHPTRAQSIQRDHIA